MTEKQKEKYDIIIGMEIHAELKTASKMFCSCNNNAEGKEPNTTVCPICLGHPGTLPVANKQAIEWTVLLGLALNCKINQFSKFDRKNYFYPDLPKGYQISQYDIPFCYNGYMDVDGENIAITRIHLEEDTGKLTHPDGKSYSYVDLNRAGTPLVELVTEPVIHSGEAARKFCETYRAILRYLDVSDADMEKGHMRCEANVSLQEKGKWKYEGNGIIEPIGDYKLNPKVELKNINSFKAVEKAVNAEIERQLNAIEEDEKLVQETRGWNEKTGQTVRQRTKETSADYRYFPEPDIPPIEISPEWIGKIRSALVELPPAKKKRFIEEYDLNDYDADILVSDKSLADFTEKVFSELREWINSNGDTWERQKQKLAKAASNWLITELFKHMKTDGIGIKDIKFTAENFAELITLVYQDKINSSAGQTIMETMYKKGGDPTDIMAELGLEQIHDGEELENHIKEVIAANSNVVAEYKNGKTNSIQFLVGKTMAATGGKANPKVVLEILTKLLNE